MTLIGLAAGPVADTSVDTGMDVDLSEYDQVDEVKSLAGWAAMGPPAPPSSSAGKADVLAGIGTNNNSNNNSEDMSACENDFVFLPEPPRPQQPQELQQQPQQQQQQQQTPDAALPRPASARPTQAKPPVDWRKVRTYTIMGPDNLPLEYRSKLTSTACSSNKEQQHRTTTTNNSNQHAPVRSQPVPSSPLSIINANLGLVCNSNSNNPFDSNANCLKQQLQQHQQQHQQVSSTIGSPSKPIGVLEISSSVSIAGTYSKLDDLLHQIVTRSDLISIDIPCAYCHELVACPPTDISAWLNHMTRVHNCKPCPICNKMIGLGPRCDLDIMRRHVVAHLDDDWLNRRAARTNFTFGLQQLWFSGTRCAVRDAKYSRY